MNIDKAIDWMTKLRPGFTAGATASKGHAKYKGAGKVEFHYCLCAKTDPSYGSHDEFVGKSLSGKVHTIGSDARSGKISCGTGNGYHDRRGVPVCEP